MPLLAEVEKAETRGFVSDSRAYCRCGTWLQKLFKPKALKHSPRTAKHIRAQKIINMTTATQV